jgi:hypothetical protein
MHAACTHRVPDDGGLQVRVAPYKAFASMIGMVQTLDEYLTSNAEGEAPRMADEGEGDEGEQATNEEG